MTAPTIRAAEKAIAASHCLLAKMATGTADHRECAWCSWSAAELSAAVDDFWEWSGSAHAVELWEATPGLVQLRRLAEAQGYREPRTIGPQER